MSEKTKVVVISVEENEKAVKLQVATEDYSVIYTAGAYKMNYNKDTKEWIPFDLETKEGKAAQAKFDEALALVGGDFNTIEGETIELYVDEKSGRAYFQPGGNYIEIDKPVLGAFKSIKRAPIVTILDSAKGRSVVVERRGKFYAFNYNYGLWIAKVGKFVLNQAKLPKQKAKFDEDFEDVDLTWDTAKEKVEQAYKNGTPFVVDCEVQKNELDESSKFGWIKGSALDREDNADAMLYMLQLKTKANDTEAVAVEAEADDLPF